MDRDMNAANFKSVHLRAEDDMEAGKLAETLHWIKFADARKGTLRISGASLGDVTLGDILTDGYEAKTTTDRVTVSLTLSGRNFFCSGKEIFEASVSDALLIQPGTRESAKRADSAGRSRTLSAIVPGPSGSAKGMAHMPVVMQVGKTATARSLRDFLVYVFAELQHDDSPLRRPDGSGSVRAMATDMVHALCDAPTPLPSSDGSAGVRVRMACDYMRAYADDPLTVEQVAKAVGLGSRSLQAAFRETLGMTPREMLAEIRL
jgi:hypothetical protein